jgi:hypothetical protein
MVDPNVFRVHDRSYSFEISITGADFVESDSLREKDSQHKCFPKALL